MAVSVNPSMASLLRFLPATKSPSCHLCPPPSFTPNTSSNSSSGCGRGVRIETRGTIPSARTRSDGTAVESEQQLDLSVLRFTLGIPGLDESYLPRYIGLAFGSLLLLNHFLTASGTPTPAQLRTEELGICLAAFSVALPYLGKFLKGARSVDCSFLPEGNKQIFVMSEDLPDTLKEDLAWGSFVLLRNTNTISVLISIQDTFCIRGYWNAPEDASKALILDWFKRQIQETGLSDLNDVLYFPQSTDQLWGILPKGTTSILLQPIMGPSDPRANEKDKVNGLVLVVSNASYAYRDRDRAWIRAVANKFQDNSSIYREG